MTTAPALEIVPLTPDRWSDLEKLFGPRGAVGGCWCMWFRQSAREYEQNKGEPNRQALKTITDEKPPGLLAYDGDEPVGWCSYAPRSEFGRLDRSRILKPVDDEPVWSIVCFFIARPARGQRVASALLEAACEDAKARGASVVEGYPVDPKERAPDPWAFTGTAAMFRAAGFEEVLRRSSGRPIMRRRLA